MSLQRPTPRYDKLVTEVKWVHKRLAEFVRKYPYYNDYFTDEEVIWKTRIDYNIFEYRKEHRNSRSYWHYFNNLHYEITKDENQPYNENTYSEDTQKALDYLIKITNAYAGIKSRIWDKSPVMKEHYDCCGCRKCGGEFPSDQFKNIKGLWYLCKVCRRNERLMHLTW